jgi:hypothetical protein
VRCVTLAGILLLKAFSMVLLCDIRRSLARRRCFKKMKTCPPNDEQFTNHLLVIFPMTAPPVPCEARFGAAKEQRTSAFETIVTLNLHLVEGQLQSV